MNNKQFLASTYTNLGKAYYSTGKNREALQALMKAKSLNEQYDNKKELAAVLIYLAGIERSMHDFGKGTELARQGLAMAQKIGICGQHG